MTCYFYDLRSFKRGMYYLCNGTAIFPQTLPVSVAATLTTPSVPAESNCSPSGLKQRLRQLPLWRRVRHTVSMQLRPACGVEEGSEGGRRFSWTWPEARPRASNGDVGCVDWAKRSEVRG